MNQSVLGRRPLATIADPSRKTILVVDDQPAILGLIRDILEDVGYATLGAESGEEALLIFDRQNAFIDVVITDVQMPRMTGIELAEALTERKAGIPIVFISGYSGYLELQSVLAVHQSDSRAVVRKPFRAIELVNRVDRMINRTSTGAGN